MLQCTVLYGATTYSNSKTYRLVVWYGSVKRCRLRCDLSLKLFPRVFCSVHSWTRWLTHHLRTPSKWHCNYTSWAPRNTHCQPMLNNCSSRRVMTLNKKQDLWMCYSGSCTCFQKTNSWQQVRRILSILHQLFTLIYKTAINLWTCIWNKGNQLWNQRIHTARLLSKVALTLPDAQDDTHRGTS